MSDDEHDNGEEGDFADWNEEEEAETRTSRCLFSSATHPNPTPPPNTHRRTTAATAPLRAAGTGKAVVC